MNKVQKILPFMLLTAILLGSCAGQAPEPSTPPADINTIMTQSVGTFVAQFFQTQTAMYTPPTPTPLNTPTPIPSSTPLPLPSPLPSATYIYSTAVVYPSATGTQYTPTVNPSTLAYGCNNLGLINDLDVAAGTVLQPGDTFTKTWQVANTGTCEWQFNYQLVFVSGNKMGGSSVRVNNPIPPNKWTKVTVNLTAPKDPGTYNGYWQMSDSSGHTFGATLVVSIVVKKPANTPTPTSYP